MYSGRLVLLAYESAPSTFTTIAGFRTNSLEINEQSVDITTKDDAGVRQLLNGNVLRSMTISGEGVVPDNVSLNAIRAAAESGTHVNLRFTIPGDSTAGGTYTGFFRVTNFGVSGAFDGEATFTASFESDGATTWAAAT